MTKALKLWKGDSDLTEIFQSVDIKFAHVNADWEQVHHPGKCRDYLGDMMWSREKGKLVRIYGLSYSYKTNPYDTETLRLSMKFPDEDSYQNFQDNFHFLNGKEEAYGIPLSKYYETDQEYTLVIEADKNWQKSVWRISLYTFYLKRMSYPDVNVLKRPEEEYLRLLTPEIEHIFLSNIMTDKAIHISETLDPNHNNSGFISLITIADYHKKYVLGSGYSSPDSHQLALKNLKELGLI